MITGKEKDYIENHAYIPEHLVNYVTAISGAEPRLLAPYLYFTKKGTLIFIGYPLEGSFEEKKMKTILEKVIRRMNPEEVSIIAPSVAWHDGTVLKKSSDTYYRLNVNDLRIGSKVRNMVVRSARDLSVVASRVFEDEHKAIVHSFLHAHTVGEDVRYIFERIPFYVSSSNSALIIDARDRDGKLVAFDIVEFGSKEYAFYMFNFTSHECYVPGASDLLFYELLKLSMGKGKTYINLGLGINEGVSFFKKKWGAKPFLPCQHLVYGCRDKSPMVALFKKL